MRLPALWIAAAFAGGIVAHGSVQGRPWGYIAIAAAALVFGFALLRRQWQRGAWCAGLTAWLAVGALAASLETAAVPENHVTRQIARGQLDSSDPLRWRGRLRSDPVNLPWGLRYEIELEEVESARGASRAAGGMRLSYYRDATKSEAAPALRAGDRIEALVRAREPRNFQNPGAFDARAHLARQGIHLTASLRSMELLRKLEPTPSPSFAHLRARARGRLLQQVDRMFAAAPGDAALTRAMLLGDYSFLDHQLAETFQKTGAYHVLVISGMHIAALAAFTFWLGRRLRLGTGWTLLLTLAAMLSFAAIVEDRPPVVRAALMAMIFLFSGVLFRRVELLNTTAVAAVLVLLAQPAALVDPSFQLSFLAGAMIGALAQPWLERSSLPYRAALRHLHDPTRDPAHAPRIAQFRLDARAAANWLAAKLPTRLSALAERSVTVPCKLALSLWEVLLISTTIQFGMLPLMAHYFHRVSPIGPLANIPATLLSALIVPLGFLAMAAEAAWSALGGATSRVLGWMLHALVNSVSWLGEFSWGAYRIPEPPAWLIAAFFACVALLTLAVRAGDADRSRRWQLVVGVPLLAAATMVAVFPFAPRFHEGRMEITTLDVGQGDALFAAFPNGSTMLIDGGGIFGDTRAGGFRTGLDIGEQVVSPYLWQRGLKQLDVVALTHAHQDHLDGLHAVLENFRVGELWVSRDADTPAYHALLATAAARGIRVVHRKRGDAFALDGVTGIALWPDPAGFEPRPPPEPRTPPRKRSSKRAPRPPRAPRIAAVVDAMPGAANNDSLVLRLEYGETSFLLPGDIEQAVEIELVARGDPLAAGGLKVAHHGSRTSTTADFSRAVSPQFAVISLSENNPFGHPHKEVQERIAATGARVLRTDRDGAVTLSSDGKRLTAETFAERKNRRDPD